MTEPTNGIMTCKDCKFFRLLGADFVNTEFYRHAGNCANPRVTDEYDPSDTDGHLIRAGGSDGYGDYFHVHEDFGCIKFEAKER